MSDCKALATSKPVFTKRLASLLRPRTLTPSSTTADLMAFIPASITLRTASPSFNDERKSWEGEDEEVDSVEAEKEMEVNKTNGYMKAKKEKAMVQGSK